MKVSYLFKNKRLFSILLVLAAHCWGCGGSVPKPENFTEDAEVILQPIADRAVESLSAELHLDAWQGGERVKFQQLIAVQKPDHLRIDSLSPFGQPLSTLVSDGETISIYSQKDRKFYSGAATPQNLARLLPIQMHPSELSALLRAEIPIIDYQTAQVSWDSDAGRTVVVLQNQSEQQILRIEPKRQLVTQSEVKTQNALRYRAQLGDYSSDAKPFPRRMRLESGDFKVEIEVKDHRIDIELADETFELYPPKGVPQIQL